MSEIKVKWYDSGRDPKSPPNPKYPNGIGVDLSKGAERTCTHILPYPAPRCGYYVVECAACSYRAVITTAGRVDDPRSVVLPCKIKAH